jgi:hypothetical protein
MHRRYRHQCPRCKTVRECSPGAMIDRSDSTDMDHWIDCPTHGQQIAAYTSYTIGGPVTYETARQRARR